VIGTSKFLRHFVFLAGIFLLQNSIGVAQEPAVPAEPVAASAAQETAEAPPTPGELAVSALREDVNILWTCLAAFLVFFMQAGFALVETGFTRAKNACNIIMKNLMDFSIGSIAFWLVGFGLMFGVSSGYIGTSLFAYDGSPVGNIESEGFGWAFLIFQTVFAATAATIVSGAVAGRTKYVGYLAYSIAITIIVYPVFGSWCWNGLVSADGSAGWLEGMGFLDFAGSTVVHSVGGWAALAGAIVIGARKGKFKNGKPVPIPGHNIPLAALGVFILWLGWFGFNPGSTTAVGRDMAYIAVTTNLAAAAGAVTAMIASWILFKKPDVSFALNGALAGLVSITAGCDIMSPAMAALTGGIGGILVVFSVLGIEKLKVDDPVGAVSVHGVCGAWGTIAIGIFSSAAGGAQLGIQLLGVAAAFLWAFPTSFIIFTIIKHTIGLRASAEDEAVGLDLSEHGMAAYPSPNFGDNIGIPGSTVVASTAPKKRVVKKKRRVAAPEGA
jgi:Amt family ammonium transporter